MEFRSSTLICGRTWRGPTGVVSHNGYPKGGCPISRVFCEKWGFCVQCSLVTDRRFRRPLASRHALGLEALLRSGRPALHYLQLLSPAPVAGIGRAAGLIPGGPGTDAPAIQLCGGGVRGDARALPSADERAAGGYSFDGYTGSQAGVCAAAAWFRWRQLPHFSHRTREMGHPR
jgi:hypothetical protein